jgi:carboxymethylenebutenolidase
MCTQDTLLAEARARRALAISRRSFNLTALSAAAVALLPKTADAAPTMESMVNVPTPDGTADCYFVHPRRGRHPAVLLWPDFMSLRPAYEQLARRLASAGYSVLAINQYYRGAKSPIVREANLDDAAARERISQLSKALDHDKIASDSKAYVAFLDQQSRVDTGRKIGVMGYCMGGRFAFLTAAAAPDRIGAIAAFHAGGLVTDKPNSPHLLVPTIRAQALIAIAADDDAKEPDTKNTLRTAFEQARLAAEISVYAGTQHGWCTPDMTTRYHPEQAQAAWARMLELFGKALA